MGGERWSVEKKRANRNGVYEKLAVIYDWSGLQLAVSNAYLQMDQYQKHNTQ